MVVIIVIRTENIENIEGHEMNSSVWTRRHKYDTAAMLSH